MVIIVSAVLLVSKEVVIRTYEIDFPGEGGDMTVLNTTVRSADVESLEKQVSSMTGYIYCDPVITDYKIVEKFGLISVNTTTRLLVRLKRRGFTAT